MPVISPTNVHLFFSSSLSGSSKVHPCIQCKHCQISRKTSTKYLQYSRRTTSGWRSTSAGFWSVQLWDTLLSHTATEAEAVFLSICQEVGSSSNSTQYDSDSDVAKGRKFFHFHSNRPITNARMHFVCRESLSNRLLAVSGLKSAKLCDIKLTAWMLLLDCQVWNFDLAFKQCCKPNSNQARDLLHFLTHVKLILHVWHIQRLIITARWKA